MAPGPPLVAGIDLIVRLPTRRRPARAPAATLALVAAGALAAPARGQDPFAPGLRWVHGASLSAPWIPESVALAAGDQLVWASGNHGQERLMVLATPGQGAVDPLFQDPGVASASGLLAVAAGRSARALYAVAQYEVAGPYLRRTEVTRHDPLAAAAGQPFAPLWAHDMGVVANGPARVACDAAGERVVAAVWDDAQGLLRARWIDGSSGATIAQLELSSANLNALALSGSGERLALAAGLDLWVFERTGALLYHELLPAATPAIALSGDGARLVVGGFSLLRVLDEGPGGYAVVAAHPGPANQVVTRVAVAADGGTYAAGWWNHVSGVRLRLQTFDGATHAKVHELIQQGQAGGLQNVPQSVVVTDDGRRVAFGCWGFGDSGPELILLDMAEPAPILEVDLPGSAMALAMDAAGTRLAVAAKNLHANQVGTTGEVRLYDTGERDLTLLAAPRLGGTLELAARRDGASWGLFLLGTRAAAPSTWPGVGGSLVLERGARMEIFWRAADASGRVDLALPLPADPALIGVELTVQAVLRSGATLHFSASAVDPLFL